MNNQSSDPIKSTEPIQEEKPISIWVAIACLTLFPTIYIVGKLIMHLLTSPKMGLAFLV